jgi:hypothetical protein
VIGPIGAGVPGLNMMLVFLLLETGYAAYITNTARDVFTATSKFIKFNQKLFAFAFMMAEISVRFFYWMFSAIAKMPEILARVVSAATDLIKTAIGIASTIITFIILMPK